MSRYRFENCRECGRALSATTSRQTGLCGLCHGMDEWDRRDWNAWDELAVELGLHEVVP